MKLEIKKLQQHKMNQNSVTRAAINKSNQCCKYKIPASYSCGAQEASVWHGLAWPGQRPVLDSDIIHCTSMHPVVHQYYCNTALRTKLSSKFDYSLAFPALTQSGFNFETSGFEPSKGFSLIGRPFLVLRLKNS